MQMYSVRKGTEGLLITEDGAVHSYQLKRGSSFFSDDIVMDPIRLYNDKRQGIYRAPTTEFEKTAERLAKNGYTVFERQGNQTQQRYGLAVIIDETMTEMD